MNFKVFERQFTEQEMSKLDLVTLTNELSNFGEVTIEGNLLKVVRPDTDTNIENVDPDFWHDETDVKIIIIVEEAVENLSK